MNRILSGLLVSSIVAASAFSSAVANDKKPTYHKSDVEKDCKAVASTKSFPNRPGDFIPTRQQLNKLLHRYHRQEEIVSDIHGKIRPALGGGFSIYPVLFRDVDKKGNARLYSGTLYADKHNKGSKHTYTLITLAFIDDNPDTGVSGYESKVIELAQRKLTNDPHETSGYKTCLQVEDQVYGRKKFVLIRSNDPAAL